MVSGSEPGFGVVVVAGIDRRGDVGAHGVGDFVSLVVVLVVT